MIEQHDSRTMLGVARGFGRGPVESTDQIAKQMPQAEIQEEFDRNAMLLEQLEKALVALHERLGPVLMNGGAVGTNAQGAAPTQQQRQSPMANMLQARNDRLEQFIAHAARLRMDLAI